VQGSRLLQERQNVGSSAANMMFIPCYTQPFIHVLSQAATHAQQLLPPTSKIEPACVCRQQCEAAQQATAEAQHSVAAGGHEAGQLRDQLQQVAAEKQRLEVALQVRSRYASQMHCRCWLPASIKLESWQRHSPRSSGRSTGGCPTATSCQCSSVITAACASLQEARAGVEAMTVQRNGQHWPGSGPPSAPGSHGREGDTAARLREVHQQLAEQVRCVYSGCCCFSTRGVPAHSAR
jgi:hypothetical protein